MGHGHRQNYFVPGSRCCDWDRQGVKRRGGGARTMITVCLGATMVMLLEQYLEELYPERLDISRIAAQVISGVGFLGAGSILVSGHQIKGLTSAASIWTCACIGLAVGIGFLDGAAILTVVWLAGVHMIPLLRTGFTGIRGIYHCISKSRMARQLPVSQGI